MTNSLRARHLAVAVILVAATVLPVPTFASDPADLHTILIRGTGTPAPLTPNEMADLKYYAEEHDQDLGQLASRHLGITAVGRVVAWLEKEYRASFVRWGLSRPGEQGNFWLLFRDEPSPEIQARVATLPVDVRLIFGAPLNAEELSTMSGALLTSLAGQTDVYLSAEARSDRYANAITVHYILNAQARRTLNSVDLAGFEATAVAAARSALPSDASGIPVSFQEDPGRPPVLQTVVQGGRDLYGIDASQRWVPVCTAGFTASVGGDRGVLTARHCSDSLLYVNQRGVISTNPVIAAPTADGRIDLQWHRTLTENGHSTNKQFRATCYDGTCDRTVTDVANAPVDSTVCHWGLGTGYACDSVYVVDTCSIISGTTYCGIDITENDISAGGDSGGPWFFGNTARGTHTGGSSSASYFTRIGRVDNNLNGTVLQE